MYAYVRTYNLFVHAAVVAVSLCNLIISRAPSISCSQLVSDQLQQTFMHAVCCMLHFPVVCDIEQSGFLFIEYLFSEMSLEQKQSHNIEH